MLYRILKLSIIGERLIREEIVDLLLHTFIASLNLLENVESFQKNIELHDMV